MFDIITFGSASQDITVKSKTLKIVKYPENITPGQGFCLPLGSKIDVDEIHFTTGGGGTNTAATFALQGLTTAFYGMVGQDSVGEEVVDELKRLNVGTQFILKTDKRPTNYSIIILQQGGNRTILAYRGASDLLTAKDIRFNSLKTLLRPELPPSPRLRRASRTGEAKWIYLAPLCDLLCDTFEDIVEFAFQHKIKVAANPSLQQLSLPQDKLKKIFKKINVLFLNQEEASFLTKIPFQKEKVIFKKIDEMCPGVAVMTKGGEGAVVSDGKYLYSAKPNSDRNVIDTTGAGDSFASGFISDFIRYNGDIEKAIQLGMANSQGCLSQVGTKNGLLKKGQKFERVKVSKTKI